MKIGRNERVEMLNKTKRRGIKIVGMIPKREREQRSGMSMN